MPRTRAADKEMGPAALRQRAKHMRDMALALTDTATFDRLEQQAVRYEAEADRLERDGIASL
jgi:hypothetical protein